MQSTYTKFVLILESDSVNFHLHKPVNKPVTYKPAAKLKCDYINSTSLKIIMSLVEFAGAFTWLITFREHVDSSDMTLVTFNSAQHNKYNMMHNTSKIFFVVKCCDNKWSVWVFIYFLIEKSSPGIGPGIWQRSINDQRESGDDTDYSKLSWIDRCASILWSDAVSSNWRFINRNTAVLLGRAISFLQS